MSEKIKLEVSDNHRRIISTTLGHLDETLCMFRQWAEGQEISSVLFKEQNALSPRQRERLRLAILELEEQIREIRDTLELRENVKSVASAIRGHCACLWADLLEIQSHHLRGYGEPSPAFVDYLDPRIRRLGALMQRLPEIVMNEEAVAK